MKWDLEEIAELCISIQQIPAPTHAEHKRAEFVASQLRRIGLDDVEIDDLPNVYGRVAGQDNSDSGQGIMVSAHLDTVFPAETDLRVRREGSRIYGPGIGDNSMGLAALITLAKRLAQAQEPPACDVWFVANAAEEGLGDLKGMRRALSRLEDQIKACIILEGTSSEPWTITHRGLGVRRYRIDVRARGGHSWGAFGEPSAIHSLVRMANIITRWEVPKYPRTTFNIGTIEGGTSVNTIAERASMLLDLRSESREELDKLVCQTEELVVTANAIGDAHFECTVVGNRPAGEIPIDHPLVRMATARLEELGISSQKIQYRIGSTDANIPLSQGLPALTIYMTEGQNSHRFTEWLALDYLATGMTLAWRLIQDAAARL